MTHGLLIATALACCLQVGQARVSIEGLPHRCWGGSSVAPVVRIADFPHEGPCSLVWALTWQDYLVTGEVVGVGVPSERGVELELPNVRARVSAEFAATLMVGGAAAAEARRAVDILPAGRLTEAAKAYWRRLVGVVVVGDGGMAPAGSLPASWVALSSAPEVRRFEGELFFLVAGERLPDASDLAAALAERMDEGATVISVGPEPSPLPGDLTPPSRPGDVRRARILAPAHALLDSVTAEDLCDWLPDGRAAVRVLPWPGAGNCRVILDVPGGDAPAALAVEVRHGAGRLLLCALPAAERLASEPIAETILTNLLSWGLSKAAPLAPAYACLRVDSGPRQAIEEVGAKFVVGRLPKGAAVLADDSLFEEQNRAVLSRCLSGGGTLLLFGLSESGLPALNAALRGRWERAAGASPPRVRTEPFAPDGQPPALDASAHPLLAGVRPEDIQELIAAAGGQDVRAVIVDAEAGHFADMLGNGLLAKFERDDVTLVFWQVPFPEEPSEAARRVLRALLTNLGVVCELRNRDL
jgi:hypothetical protein